MSTDHNIPSWRKHIRIDLSRSIQTKELDEQEQIVHRPSTRSAVLRNEKCCAGTETDSDEDRFAAWFEEMIVRSE